MFGRYRYEKKVRYVSRKICPEPESTVQNLTGNMFRFELDRDDHCCAAHIGMDGIRIEKEPRQRDEYVYRIS
jgi:hypothetical protein